MRDDGTIEAKDLYNIRQDVVLYWRLEEAIECMDTVCKIVEKDGSALDCLRAMIDRRKHLQATIDEQTIKEIIE